MKFFLLFLIITQVATVYIDYNAWVINCARFCAGSRLGQKFSLDTPEHVNEISHSENFPQFLVYTRSSCVCVHHDEKAEVNIIIC